MRYYNALALALLAVISLELGSISIRLPTPVVQAQLSAPVGPPQQNVSQVLNEHDKRVIALLGKVDALTSKVDALTSKVEALTSKVDALSPKVDAQLSKFESLQGKVDNVDAKMKESLGCLKSTSSRLNNIFKQIQANQSGSNKQLQSLQELGC